MPMIDVYAAAARSATSMHWLEAGYRTDDDRTGARHPDVPEEHAAFVHELPSSGLSNVDGDSTNVRFQVLTNAGPRS